MESVAAAWEQLRGYVLPKRKTPEQARQSEAERVRFEASKKLTPEEQELEKLRCKDECAHLWQAVIDCQQSRTAVFRNFCNTEANEFFACFRDCRGFARVRLLGVDFDVSPMIQAGIDSAQQQAQPEGEQQGAEGAGQQGPGPPASS